ncbi:MAG: TIGR03032 family protein [Spirulinaceae cyanobacterium]
MKISYVHSGSFPEILAKLNLALFVSTYQAGKLMIVRSKAGQLVTLLRSFQKVMGLALQPHRLAIGTRKQVWFLPNVPGIAHQVESERKYDACFVPRHCHVTGDIRIHEIAWVEEELWIVNTRFSCLCTLSPEFNFVPQWKPQFISSLKAEDRCHLNGLALLGGKPRLVTALGDTDTPGGWREGKVGGGCLIDIPSGEIVARGFAMPHSPRFYDGGLWLLDSGYGHLVRVDLYTGQSTIVAELPGFTRGLAFYGRYGFVGLSQVREKKVFGGLPLQEREKELQCAVVVIDIYTGKTVGFLKFDSGCTELFDLQLLPGFSQPTVIGLQKDTLDKIFIF